MSEAVSSSMEAARPLGSSLLAALSTPPMSLHASASSPALASSGFTSPAAASSPILAHSHSLLSQAPPRKGRRLDDLVLSLHRRGEKPPSPDSSPTTPVTPTGDLSAAQLQAAALLLANRGLPRPQPSLPSSPSPRPPPSPKADSMPAMRELLGHGRPSPKAPKRAAPKPGCELTTPKLSRHNDAAYYPNIQCILCSEWVCSRNRYMHIESHLQYRPYKCSLCGYDNRKEIFINLHIKRTHKGDGKVVYAPDAELEHRAWQLAEQCLQHTRRVLIAETDTPNEDSETGGDVVPSSAQVAPEVLEPYRAVYRPKIYNTQRAEKSQLIEESRQLGLVPDFSEVASKEELCGRCGSHILRHHAVLEEHVRTHLPRASYRCNIEACPVAHESKNFISRHMKEVHKYRRQPLDLLDEQPELVDEYLGLCSASFPLFFEADALRRIRYRYSSSRLRSEKPPPPPPTVPELPTKRACQLCQVGIGAGFPALLEHILSHVSRAQFACLLCGRSESSQALVLQHAAQAHPSSASHQIVQKILTPESKAEVETLFKVCFPGANLSAAVKK